MNIPLSRRDAIRLGLMSVAGVWISNRFSVPAWGVSAPATAAAPTGKAKAVIQIWLWGGPSHLDTFDPKPEAGNDYAGPLKAIETNVSGIRICELLPLLAKQAHRYALIRSMTHGNNGHETAAYIVQTGRKPGDSLVYPAMGAVVSLFKGYDAGYKGLVPPYIVLTEPQGRFSEAGFLGLKYKPFATGGDPSRTPFVVEGVVAQGISEQRQKDRRELRAKLDALEHVLPADPQIQAFQQGEKQAYDLILGDAGKVFDLTQEKQELREQYGLTKFGQSCLLARRLVEKGVPYITINSGGWDTHKQNFEAMRRKLPELDKGLATLLQDLADRGLLASTIVTCYGEFGRTPKIDWQAPWNGGRGHWGKVFSVLLAGGGFKGGQVVGASTEKGEEVKDRRVTPADLIASIYEQLGINPDARLPHPQGLPVQVMPEATAKLKELV
jgi:hypothetical protein